jgi:hypothetical protein
MKKRFARVLILIGLTSLLNTEAFDIPMAGESVIQQNTEVKIAHKDDNSSEIDKIKIGEEVRISASHIIEEELDSDKVEVDAGGFRIILPNGTLLGSD